MNLCHDQKPQEKVNYKPNRDWRAHYMVAQEPGIGEVYRCKLCGKNYSKMIKIKNHVKNHFKDIKCDRCDLMFVSESKLKTHYVVHTKIRQHKCEFCGKDFYRKNNLTQHLKLHRNERNYACEFCGKTFTYRESMKSHIRNNHLRESPYECVPCTKKFVDPASLARHMAAEHKPPQTQPVVVQQIDMMPAAVTVTLPVVGPPAPLATTAVTVPPSMGGTIIRFDGTTMTAAELGAFTVAGVFPPLGRQ